MNFLFSELLMVTLSTDYIINSNALRSQGDRHEE